VPVPSHPRELPAGPVSGITFDHVSFAYPGGTEQAVAGLNLEVRPGELIALVGENGAGKSTVVKLLLRFYDVDAGAVRVGGIDVRELSPETLRNRIGVLFQDYASYEFSVRENVAMGRPDGVVDDDRVLRALRDSRSEWLVRKMPHGLASKVVARPGGGGRHFRGVEGPPPRPNRHRHLAPVFDGPHRRSNRRDCRWPREGNRHSRGADPRAQPLLRALRAASGRIPLIALRHSLLHRFHSPIHAFTLGLI
jgi:hypothetical protein